MNNINTIDKNNNPKPNSRKNLGYIFMIAGLLNANSPIYAKTSNYNNTTTEQVTPQTNTLNGIKLPTVYQNKLDDFLANNNVMKDNDAKNYTLNFVEKEMESDRGISKENQLLFIRHAIYKQVTDQDLYDGQDGSQKLAEDFSNKAVSIRIRACGQKYRNGIITYMNEISAEARQQSAEAQQRSANAIKETMKADSLGLQEMVKYYNLCIKTPDTNNQDEIENVKKAAKDIIQNCKKYGINYRAILLKEVGGDTKKVDEILKFYGVE